MVYNPIFEEEVQRDVELGSLRRAIKTRAAQDQFQNLCQKFTHFVKAHPIFTTVALGVFGLGITSSHRSNKNK
jgi:hypothetical protein